MKAKRGAQHVYTLLGLLVLAGLAAGACKKTEASVPVVEMSPAATPAAKVPAKNAAAAKQKGEMRWVQLFVDEASASSFLQNDWNKFVENYHPSISSTITRAPRGSRGPKATERENGFGSRSPTFPAPPR